MSKWFNLRNSASGTLTIDILDVVGMWGITAKDFLDQVKAAGAFTAIELNVNSPGGDVLEGFTIYDGLRALDVDITVNVIGTAASMASVIILAGKTIRIAENGQVMIHRVTSGAGGNADELAAAAKITQQFEDRIVGIYVERTGQDEATIRDWMKTEQGTWFIGQEAIDAGFATELIKAKKAAAFKGEWAALFTMLPAALFDTSSPATPHASSPQTPMKLLIALAAKFGITIPADSDEEAALTLINAYTPPGKNVVIDFEDADVKAGFAARITDAIKPFEAKVAAVEAENKKLTALITNGAAGAAGGNPAIAAAAGNQQETIMDRFNAITDPKERTAFYNKHKAELRAAGPFQKAA
jgi:ATP-dependent Clp endopeptidase proteolytic subunit ClpP